MAEVFFIQVPTTEFWEKIETICFNQSKKALDECSQKQQSQKLLNTNEVAALLGVSRVTVANYVRRGVLLKLKIKGSTKSYYRLEQIEDLLKNFAFKISKR